MASKNGNGNGNPAARQIVDEEDAPESGPVAPERKPLSKDEKGALYAKLLACTKQVTAAELALSKGKEKEAEILQEIWEKMGGKSVSVPGIGTFSVSARRSKGSDEITYFMKRTGDTETIELPK